MEESDVFSFNHPKGTVALGNLYRYNGYDKRFLCPSFLVSTQKELAPNVRGTDLFISISHSPKVLELLMRDVMANGLKKQFSSIH